MVESPMAMQVFLQSRMILGLFDLKSESALKPKKWSMMWSEN